MTHPLIRNVLMLLASGAIGAYASSAAAEGLRPNFPIRLPEAAPPAAADAPVATAPKAAPAKAALRLTPIGVESRPLEPVAAPQRAAAPTLRHSPSDFKVDEWPEQHEAGLIKVANRKKATSHKAAAEEPEAPATYTVRKGDTLDKIADKLGVSVAELKRINGLKRSTIHPGQKLKGPAPAGGAKASAHKDTGKKESARKAAAKPETYTVKRGDTLFSIARRHGLSVEELRAANGLRAKSAIHAGQKLKLGAAEEEATADETPTPRHGRTATRTERTEEPAEETTAGGRTITTRSVTGRVIEIPGGASSYRVRKGDTIGEVADKLGVSVATLKKTNRLKSNTIRKGQVLKGPKTTAHAYVAASGDTIAGIAKRFGVSPEALRAANGLKRSVLVARPGQKLRLPAGFHDRGSVTVTTRVPAPATEAPPAYTPPPRREEPAPALPSRPQPYSGGSRYTPPPVAPAPAAPSISDAQISQLGRGRFVWPVQGEIISSFGAKPGGTRNDGINIRASTGDPVRVAASGDVVYAGDQVPGFGNLVLVKHPDGWVTAYGHLSRIDVKMQQRVTQGQQIGLAGSTGGVAEPQVHFEIRYGAAGERARPIDPSLVLPR